MRSDRMAAGTGAEMNIEWLASPATVFSHPRDVLAHPALEKSEKRAILASWASDVRAVENEPALRQVECGAIVALADILAALRALDGQATPPAGQFRQRSGGGRTMAGRRAIFRRG